MAELDLHTRHHYLENTLARTLEWLADDGVRQILGATALETVESLITRLYVPNITKVGNWYVTLETPLAYRDDTSLPVMAGFPGDRLVPDGPMRRQTALQRNRSIARLSEVYEDPAWAAHIVEGRDRRLRSQGNSMRTYHVSRYDADASTGVSTVRVGPKRDRQVLMGRPLVTFTMGDIDEGYTVAAPPTLIHELLHADDHLQLGCLAVAGIHDYILATEFRAHHYGSRIERYGVDNDLVRPDEWNDYNRISDRPTFSERFEAIRVAHASSDDPFAANDAANRALVAADML